MQTSYSAGWLYCAGFTLWALLAVLCGMECNAVYVRIVCTYRRGEGVSLVGWDDGAVDTGQQRQPSPLWYSPSFRTLRVSIYAAYPTLPLTETWLPWTGQGVFDEETPSKEQGRLDTGEQTPPIPPSVYRLECGNTVAILWQCCG